MHASMTTQSRVDRSVREILELVKIILAMTYKLTSKGGEGTRIINV